MRELPGQLSVDELTPLFSGRTRLVEELAGHEDPLGVAEDVALALPEADQVAALATHPRIGEPSEEQRGAEPEVLEELARLNEDYERRFGFGFVVFVDGRTRAELVPVLRERLERSGPRSSRPGCASSAQSRGDAAVDADYLREVADLVLRLLHVVAGIAWIGASFYFIRLDLGLAPPKEAQRGGRRRVLGRARRRLLPLAEVQGGAAEAARAPALVQVGGVHDLALRLRAARRPLLAGRGCAARRPAVADLSGVAGGGALGRGARARVARLRRRLPLLRDDRAWLAVAALVSSAWAAGELFAARASYLQVGAMLGTIMAANVFFTIIPAHWELVRAKQKVASRTPRGAWAPSSGRSTTTT